MTMIHEVVTLDVQDDRTVIKLKRSDGKHSQVQLASRIILHDVPNCTFGQVMLHAFFTRGEIVEAVTR